MSTPRPEGPAVPSPADPAETIATAASARSLHGRVLQLVQRDFEPSTWRAFWACIVAERSPTAVAAELGLTVAAVYQGIRRVRLRLRQELERFLDSVRLFASNGANRHRRRGEEANPPDLPDIQESPMVEATSCPAADSLRQYLDGGLPDPDATVIEQHLTHCSSCLTRLEPLLATLRSECQSCGLSDAPSAPPDLIQRLQRLRTAPPGPATADDSPSVGDTPTTIGRYQLRRRIGAGGMGTVYEAHDPDLDRAVAVKLPHFDGPPERQATARQRFLREARAAARVRHPHICPIYDVGEQAGQPYVVLALVEGGSLAEHLKARGRFTDDAAALRLVLQVAGALQVLHAQGILHRDLKPGNILLDATGQALFTDFGLARFDQDAEALTGANAIVGTPAYMAPEQATPALGPVTPQSDQYSLGVVLYHLLTGRMPFQGTTPQLLQQLAHADAPPPTQFRPDLDPRLAAILTRTLSRQPADRYADVSALAQALSDWLSGSTHTAPPVAALPQHAIPTVDYAPGAATTSPVTPSTVTPPRPGRRWLLPGLAAGVVLLLLGGVAGYWLTRPAASLPPPVPPPGVTYRGWVDVVVWDEKDPARQRRGLADAGSLPLKPGDQVRLEAEVEPAAFLYLFWIDTEGAVTPIYPWRSWKTGRVPEEARTRLSFPEEAGKAAGIPPEGRGMETVVLLACDGALDVDLESLLKGLPPQRPWQNERAAVWFQNGDIVTNEPERAPQFFENLQEINDPVLRVQQLLKDKVQPHVRYSRAVSFAKKGQPIQP